MKLFQVLYDGASRPIIQTPTGRWLSLSQFNNGRWRSYEQEDSDCRSITEALNWILINAPQLIREWEVDDAPLATGERRRDAMLGDRWKSGSAND